MNAKKLLGLRIRGLRKKQGLRQEDVAAKASITPKYLSDIELGKENPTFDVFSRIAVAFKMELWELLNYGNELSKAELKKELISFAQTSSEEDLRMTMKFIKAVLK